MDVVYFLEIFEGNPHKECSKKGKPLDVGGYWIVRGVVLFFWGKFLNFVYLLGQFGILGEKTMVLPLFFPWRAESGSIERVVMVKKIFWQIGNKT